MLVLVKSLAGSLPPIEISKRATVGDLTERIRRILTRDDVSVNDRHRLRLMIVNNDGEDYQELEDNTKTLSDYGITGVVCDLILVVDQWPELSKVYVQLHSSLFAFGMSHLCCFVSARLFRGFSSFARKGLYVGCGRTSEARKSAFVCVQLSNWVHGLPSVGASVLGHVIVAPKFGA
jgi:hypothetical protein